MMRSHSYDFEARDVMRLIGPSLVPVAVFAALMHGGSLLHLLPRPRPTLDVDRTIVIHKVEASGSRSEAEVLLMGDSSCLIDVSAIALGEQIGSPVLNLGMLSYLDLDAHASLLRRFVTANPNQLRAVVLLLHPEALRRPAAERYHTEFFRTFLAGEDHIARQNVAQWLGLEIFRGRVVGRALPTPLPGAYGRYYGFTSDLEDYLTRNRGSAVDPDPRAFEGSREYRLAPQLESASRAFKAAVPNGAKLIVGITPVPEGFAGSDYPEVRRRMLAQWRDWLQADAALEGLPATLPDDRFAKTTHLNQDGTRTYTRLLADALERLNPGRGP